MNYKILISIPIYTPKSLLTQIALMPIRLFATTIILILGVSARSLLYRPNATALVGIWAYLYAAYISILTHNGGIQSS